MERRELTRFFAIEYYANFAVVRSTHTSFVYIVFYGGHVNCTGISTRAKISDAIRLFKAAFQVGSVSYRVRAIAATGDTTILFTPNSVQQLKQALPTSDNLFCIREFFTGVLIRFGEGGTAQIFFSGKVNFLGAKSEEHLFRMGRVVKRLLLHV